MNCPQCRTKMQSERSATPNIPFWRSGMFETRHYRCEECDAEYVRGEGKVLVKIDGGLVPLDCTEMEEWQEV